MSTKHRKKHHTQSQRIECVEAWRRSGMSRRQFALQVGISEKTFCRWVRKLQSSAKKASIPLLSKPPKTLSLLPVTSPRQQSPKPVVCSENPIVEAILPRGIRLRFNALSEPRKLAALIKELEQCS